MNAFLSDFPLFVEKTLSLWHVPGLSVAMVMDGQVTMLGGYGLRDIAQALPVTSETLFPIASCTKAFTALALGMLVEEGRLGWDRPVRDFLPALKLWDAGAAEHITTRDLLTHRSGLPGHDMLWYASRFTRREIFDRLCYLEPTCELRTTFQYQNLMYLVAGLLVEEISGQTWEQFIQERILNPLEMKRTNFSARATLKAGDHALPYRYRAGRITEMAYRWKDSEPNPMAPAGGLYSCASDMAKWLAFLLDEGKINGQPLIRKKTLQEIFTPQIFMDNALAREYLGFEFNSYGFGWNLHTYKAHFMAEHDGQADGFYSFITLLPRDGLGIVALSNCDAYYNPVQDNLAPNVISYTLTDRQLGSEPTDWNALLRAIHDEQQTELKPAPKRPDGPDTMHPPSHPMEAYLGEYEHPGYGRVSIRQNSALDGEPLSLVINDKLALPLVPCDYDIFEIVFEIVDQRQMIAFFTGPDGKISQVAIAMEPRVTPIVFERVGSVDC